MQKVISYIQREPTGSAEVECLIEISNVVLQKISVDPTVMVLVGALFAESNELFRSMNVAPYRQATRDGFGNLLIKIGIIQGVEKGNNRSHILHA